MNHFFAQSFPDIEAKLKWLEKGPLTPQAEILEVAFKVFNGRDERAQKEIFQILAKATRQPAVSDTLLPTGALLTAGILQVHASNVAKLGHWARICPCPKCYQWTILLSIKPVGHPSHLCPGLTF